MLGRIINILYGSEAAEFRSGFSVAESVRRLAGARAPAGRRSARRGAVGTVGPSRVVLRRSIPFVENSCRPLFVGRFEQRDGETVLAGRFTMHWSVKVSMTVWLGFCLLWTLVVFLAVVFLVPELWFLPVAGAAMFYAALVGIHLGHQPSCDDVQWLSTLIARALRDEAA